MNDLGANLSRRLVSWSFCGLGASSITLPLPQPVFGFINQAHLQPRPPLSGRTTTAFGSWRHDRSHELVGTLMQEHFNLTSAIVKYRPGGTTRASSASTRTQPIARRASTAPEVCYEAVCHASCRFSLSIIAVSTYITLQRHSICHSKRQLWTHTWHIDQRSLDLVVIKPHTLVLLLCKVEAGSTNEWRVGRCFTPVGRLVTIYSGHKSR